MEKDDRLFPVLVYTRRSVTSRRRYLVTGSDGLENPVGGEGIVEGVSRRGREGVESGCASPSWEKSPVSNLLLRRVHKSCVSGFRGSGN